MVELIPGTSNIGSKVVGGEPSVQIPLMSEPWTTLLGKGVHLSESASHMLQSAFTTSLVLEPVSSVRHEAAAAFFFFFFFFHTSHITSYLARTDKMHLHHLHYSTKYSRLCTSYIETLLIAITIYSYRI